MRTRPAVLLAAALVALAGCGERVLGPGPAGEPPAADRAPIPEYLLSAAGLAPDGRGEDLPPSVPGQLVAEIAPGWTAERIASTWGLEVLHVMEDEPFGLLDHQGLSYDVIAYVLVSEGACVSCERNWRVESPESLQGSIAFYEGDLVEADMADQEAFARVGVDVAHGFATGAGVTVAIVDTGIDATHPALAGAVIPGGHDLVDGDDDASDETDGHDQDQDGLVDEAAGHGTHVAGIVHAIAPGAALLPVRVLDTEGRGSVYDVARGIRIAAREGARIVNLSLGFRGTSRVLERAIERVTAEDIFVVSAAGNAGVYADDQFPASLPQVASVASVDAADLKSPFSSFGHTVALSAPGEGIVSTYLFHGYAVWSGTSMAVPFVSGAGALAIELGGPPGPATLVPLAEASAELPHEGQPYAGLMGAGRLDLALLPKTSD